MQESFLAHDQFRYLKIALALVAVALVIYIGYEPVGGRGGDSWVGYGLGGLAAALVLLLLWYGIRKRRFYSTMGTVRGWLSAHVYLGGAVVIIATLHCAFEFGFNIHTLAYALLVATVASGLYGAYAYARFPSLMSANRVGVGLQAMLDEVASLEQQAVELADRIDDATHQIALRSFRSSTIGGGLLTQLRGGRPKQARKEEQRAEEFLNEKNQTLVADLETIKAKEAERIMNAESTMQFVASNVARAEPGQQVERMRQLMDLLRRRRTLVDRLNQDIQHRALLQLWLYLHVPLSVGLLAALGAHVVSVFTYW